jgi:diketogulonate reductase-like aldo/keto reductase
MSDHHISVDGIQVPRFLYGTAWKEERTELLVGLALQQGFRGIDTANQRRHYDEAAVGRALRAALAAGLVTREGVFLQTKFTFRGGQDQRLPYDPAAPVSVQVEQSFASSVEHLGTEVIDSYVLHGPSRSAGLGAADWDAWHAMENLHVTGRARLLGVSNVSLDQLRELWQGARVQPRFVQNRCYASRGWDRNVRQFCAANEIVYQGFSLLTANRSALSDPKVARIAQRYGKSPNQIVFRFAVDVGMLPLTGTTDPAHMREDLEVLNFRLSADQVERIDRLLLA